MHALRNITLWAVLATLAALGLSSAVAFAHERRDIAGGAYQAVVGFIVEPPYEGQKNGVDFRITRKADNTPLTGAEATLKVEVTYVPSNVSKTFDLRTIFGDPGHYTADLIPTQPGYYRMRFFGTISDGGKSYQVDETFNSRAGGGNFNDVQSSADLQFPDKLPTVRELESATRGALSAAQGVQGDADDAMDMAHTSKAAADDAKSNVGSATTLAIAGIVLGLMGTAAGVSGIVMGRRKPAAQ